MKRGQHWLMTRDLGGHTIRWNTATDALSCSPPVAQASTKRRPLFRILENTPAVRVSTGNLGMADVERDVRLR